MNEEVLKRWNDLGIGGVAINLGKDLNPTSNYFPERVRGDGLVEMTIEEHEGYDDSTPKEYMRFSFDGSNLLVSMTKSEKPFLGLIETGSMNMDELQESLTELVVRK